MLICICGFTDAKAKPKTVACIGDSNTFRKNYPAHLQKLLGKEYQVHNYGVSGASLLSGWKLSYLSTPAYKKALAAKPDIVVIMLGTNDSSPLIWKDEVRDKKFPGTPSEEFTVNMQKLVSSFISQNKEAKIYLVKPLPVFPSRSPKDWRHITEGRKKVLEGEIYELVETLADKLKIPMIDAYTPMKSDIDLTQDGIHFKDAGYKKLATIISTALSKKTMDVNEHDASYEAGNSNAYNKDLPQVFSCGDSISAGYAPFLKKELKGRYSVVHRKDTGALFSIHENYTGLAPSLISLTNKVLTSDKYKPEYLLLNCGLHDAYRGKGGIKQYEKDLKQIIKLAKDHKVKLVWLTTTYKAKGDPKTKIVIDYNKKAMRLMKREKCELIDLGAYTLKLIKREGQAKIMSKDKVHFTPLGYELQAKYIAEELTRVIK